MKRFLFTLMATAMCWTAMMLPATAFAYDFEIDGIYYLAAGSYAMVTYENTDYNSYSGDVTIPATVTYNGQMYTVLTIGSYAFRNCSSLTSITIPNSVTSIGDGAFAYCSNLASITIPNSVTSIGEYAFGGCTSLTELYFNAISCDGFNSSSPPFANTFIATIQIGDSVQKIPANFMNGLTTLRSVTMGNSVTTIGSSAFYGCTSLTDVSMGNFVTTIENSAFYGCTGLKNITLSNAVTTINNSAFEDCTGLMHITLGDSVTTIYDRAFEGCLRLNSISLPSTLRTISSKAFYNCSGLVTVYSLADFPPVMESSDCFNVYNTAILLVPREVLETYKNTYYWNYFNKTYGIDANGNILADGIALNVTNKSLNVGQTFMLTATISPNVATNKTVQWSSSNNSVATVNDEGLVTAIADGNTTITATTTDGTNLSASCTVTVSSIPITSISLNKTSLTLDVSDTYQLVATISPTNASNKTIEWSSSNPTVATVSDNGFVTSVAPGEASITATTTDGTNLIASCQVTVVKRVHGITFNESSLTLTLPETAQLIANLTPSDATNQVLNWTSSKPSVATVDNNGFITSVGVGTTTIKATTTDGSNLSASCQVTVVKQNVTSITLSESHLVMHIGDAVQLIADVQPENASNPNVSWSTGNFSIASVDNNGLVTANAGGTTYVRATATDGSYTYAQCAIEVLYDYYLTLDTLSHIRGAAPQIIDLPVSLINKNPISGIQFDVSLPDSVSFNLIDGMPDVWLDDARATRSHSISCSQLSNGKYRILVTSSSSKNLKGNDGELVHMNMLLPRLHNTGNYSIYISNIIASESDETPHTLPNTSTKVSFYYIVGDADANAIVDIADYTATASKILGMSPSPFYFNAADVDGNYSLNVVDLVGITNIALEIRPITIKQAPVRDYTENRLFCDKLMLNAGGETEINVGINCGFSFAGFQMDLALPEGLTLTGAELGDQTSRFGLAAENMADGKIRILGTSFSDAEVSGSCPDLLKLKVKADKNYLQGSNIDFSDILFAERDLTGHHFDGSSIEFIEPSSVYELRDDTHIYVKDGNVIVDTPVAGTVQLIAVDGRMTEYEAHIGHNIFTFGVNGIYMIHFNGKTIKVRL